MLIESADEARPAFYVCRHLRRTSPRRATSSAPPTPGRAEDFPGVDFPAFLDGPGPDGPPPPRRRLLAPRPLERQRPPALRAGRQPRRSLSGGPQPHADGPAAQPLRAPARPLADGRSSGPSTRSCFLAGYWGGRAEGSGARPLSRLSPRLPPEERDRRSGCAAARPGEAACSCRGRPRPHPRRRRPAPRRATRWSGTASRTSPTSTPAGSTSCGSAWPTPGRTRDGGRGRGRRPAARSGGATGSCRRELHAQPVDFARHAASAVRPWPESAGALLALVERAGRAARPGAAPSLGGRPRRRGGAGARAPRPGLRADLRPAAEPRAGARPRALARAPSRRSAARFTPYGRASRSARRSTAASGGSGTSGEYVALARAAEEILRRHPGVELLGPSVIDFEYHVTAAVLNLRRPGFRFDAVSALLYVDRRGAPENRQAGLDTEDKVAAPQGHRRDRPQLHRPLLDHRGELAAPRGAPLAGRPRRLGGRGDAGGLSRPLLPADPGDRPRRAGLLVAGGGPGLRPGRSRRSGEPAPRPSFLALQTLIRELDGARLERSCRRPARPALPLPATRRRRGGGGLERGGQPVKATLPRPAVR